MYDLDLLLQYDFHAFVNPPLPGCSFFIFLRLSIGAVVAQCARMEVIATQSECPNGCFEIKNLLSQNPMLLMETEQG